MTKTASLVLSLCIYAGATIAAEAAGNQSFLLIDPPQPTQTPGKIEVLEVFWYGCPHCYAFEPFLREWLGTQPAEVKFRLLPGTLGRNWIPHAKAYFTAVRLGVLEQIHEPLFDAIHKDRREIFTDAAIREFFVEQGVNGAEFDAVYGSAEVWDQVVQAHEQLKKYQITGVPSVIINGRYLTGPGLVADHQDLLKVIDELIKKEQLAGHNQ